MALYASVRGRSVRKIGGHFESFLQQNLVLGESRYRSFGELKTSDEFSDDQYFCVGSDQVWNVDYNKDNRPYYLEFAPEGAKKFSLASSIGMSRLPEHEEDALYAALSKFHGVSVREREAAEYIRGLGIPAEHHVDPTLAVRRGFWDEFAGQSREDQPYLLVYQLNPNSQLDETVKELSRRLDLPVRRIEYGRSVRNFGKPIVALPAVKEFIRLFRDASFVVTDSFHGTSFSTIFERDMVAVAPPRYAGRIRSLLALVDREHLLVSSEADLSAALRIDCSLAGSTAVLDRERDRVSGYLGSVLTAA